MLAPATAGAPTGDGLAEGIQAGASALLHGSGVKKLRRFLLLALLAVLPTRCPATSTFEPYTLKVKTCNATRAGTVGQLFLSFCDGFNSCLLGPTNVYNSKEELNAIGAWNTLEVPLDYEPTTMSMALVGDDAWCVEEVVWNDRGNMLGTGGRLYLDGDLGEGGCSFGVVHTDTGWRYPCKSSWRFFNLPEADDYRYEIKVKPCGSSTSTAAGSKLASSPKVAASLCSESLCNRTVGQVIDFDLSVIAAAGGGSSGWATSLVSAGFNPVAMKLTNTGDFPWCAAAITFNDYTLIDENEMPQGMKLGVGDDRRFSNVQFLGAAALAFSEPSDGSEDDDLKHKAWELAWEVFTSVLIFTATVAITVFVRRFKRGNDGEDGDDDGGSFEGGVGGEAEESPLHQTGHHANPPSGPRGQGSTAATAAAAGENASLIDGASSRQYDDSESGVFCFQQRQQAPTTPSCNGDDHGQERGVCRSSSRGYEGMPSSRASSTETVVVAYHHPWELEPA